MKTKMNNWICVEIVLAFCASVNAVGFHGLHFKGLEEPVWVGPRTVRDKWIEQPVDHFNHRDIRTWLMRYYEEDKYFDGSGPIFIMLGGEWTISPGFLQTGLMHDLAQQHNALMFYTEHRYYGESKPTENVNSDNMQYLNVDQALADVAYFIDHIRIEKNISSPKVIAFGGSYAGNMATWIRIKYPHLIQGAVASSAPIHAKADFYEYYELVTASLMDHDIDCALQVGNAFEHVESLIGSENGPEELRSIFNLCEKLNVKSSKDIGYFMNGLSEVFAAAVQYNRVNNNVSNIGKLCQKMTDPSIIRPIDRLAKVFNQSDSCNDVKYSSFLELMTSEAWSSNIMRQWYFQTCSEYGYYQTSNSEKSVFGTLFKIDFFINMCTDFYGRYFDKNFLNEGVKRTNIVYGGNLPDVTNVVFVNGNIDPWHALSILQDLNRASPAIFIKGSSHCQDLQPDADGDVPALREARIKIKNIVSSWLQYESLT